MNRKNLNKATMKHITMLFGVILSFLLVILVLVRIIIQFKFGLQFDFANFIDNLVGSILGIILPLLIFNVFYEYFMRVYSSNEISEKITETIMSNKEVIDKFECDTKQQFIKTTLQSILKPEKGDVVYEMVSPYLQSKLNLRKEFKYTIILDDITESECCKWGSYLDTSKYNLLTESLSYTKIYTDENRYIPDYLSIGFFVDENILDQHFKSKDYIFRECFFMSKGELEKVKLHKEEFISNCMCVNLYVNEIKLDINSTDVSEKGIVITYKIPQAIKLDEVKYDITFSMPQIKEKNDFLVILHEPTYRPQIKFIYPRETYEITTIPFFDESYQNNTGINDIDGIRELELSSWVLPRSGAVFIWNRK